MKKYIIVSALLLSLLCCGSLPGYAQEDEDFWTAVAGSINGSLKNFSAVRLTEADRFTTIHNRLELKYDNWLNDTARLSLSGWAVYDGVYAVEDGLNPDDEEDYESYLSLREAVLALTLGDLDLLLGKQQVIWGKTDGFRVTDVVNPLDVREAGLKDFLDQRIPLWMMNAEYYVTTDFALQALIIPDLRFMEYAAPDFPDGTELRAVEEPPLTLENAEYGLRFTGFVRGWDVTMNYLYSWDDLPVYKTSVDPNTGGLTIAPEYERVHILGGTVANVLWNTVFRGEIAANFGKYFSVADPAIPDMALEKTELNYAIAAERDLFDIHWLAQGLQQVVLEYDDSITTDRLRSYLTLQGSKNFLHETLTVDASVIYEANHGQFTIEPSFSYAVNDAFSIEGGLSVLAGGDKEDDDNRERVYIELTYSF